MDQEDGRTETKIIAEEDEARVAVPRHGMMIVAPLGDTDPAVVTTLAVLVPEPEDAIGVLAEGVIDLLRDITALAPLRDLAGSDLLKDEVVIAHLSELIEVGTGLLIVPLTSFVDLRNLLVL
jgi:hypothetical protein